MDPLLASPDEEVVDDAGPGKKPAPAPTPLQAAYDIYQKNIAAGGKPLSLSDIYDIMTQPAGLGPVSVVGVNAEDVARANETPADRMAENFRRNTIAGANAPIDPALDQQEIAAADARGAKIPSIVQALKQRMAGSRANLLADVATGQATDAAGLGRTTSEATDADLENYLKAGGRLAGGGDAEGGNAIRTALAATPGVGEGLGAVYEAATDPENQVAAAGTLGALGTQAVVLGGGWIEGIGKAVLEKLPADVAPRVVALVEKYGPEKAIEAIKGFLAHAIGGGVVGAATGAGGTLAEGGTALDALRAARDQGLSFALLGAAPAAVEGLRDVSEATKARGEGIAYRGAISKALYNLQNAGGAAADFLERRAAEAATATAPEATGAAPTPPPAATEQPAPETEAPEPYQDVPEPELTADQLREQRDAARRALATSAVSGLPNERAWNVMWPRAQATPGAKIGLIDFSNWKAFNDKNGWVNGDAQLRAWGQQLDQIASRFAVPGPDGRPLLASDGTPVRGIQVAHPHGDEFGFIVDPRLPSQAAATFLQQAHQEIQPIQVGDFRVHFRGGIGETYADAQSAFDAAKKGETGPKYRGSDAEAAAQAPKLDVGPVTADDPLAVAQSVQEGHIPPPGAVVRFPVDQIHTDPERFQFRTGTDAEGQTGAFKGVRWNDAYPSPLTLWRDPDDGKVYVVNGHQRLGIAKASGVSDVPVRFSDAPDAKGARVDGTLINLAEAGNPTKAVDVAKFFRDTGTGPGELASRDIRVNAGVVKKGLALKNLSPELFNDVVTGRLSEDAGAVIGDMLQDPELQREAVRAIGDKRLTPVEIREVARQVRDAPTTETSQETLFGTETDTKSLYAERAQIAADFKRRLGSDKRLFGTVADEGRAGRLETAGAGEINRETAADLADRSKRASDLFDRLYTRSGPISDIVNEGARRLADGEKLAAVSRDLYEPLHEAVQAELAPPAAVHESVAAPAAPPPAATDASERVPQPPTPKEPIPPEGAPEPLPPRAPVKPHIVAGWLNEVGDDLRKAFAPGSRSEEAGIAQMSLRANLGEEARRNAMVEEALHQTARMFDAMRPGERLLFMDGVETGKPQTTPELDRVALHLRQLLDQGRDAVRALGTGKLRVWLDNYFPHLWEKPEQAASAISRILARRPLEGSAGFLKERSIPTVLEGMFPEGAPANLAELSQAEIDAEVQRQGGLTPVSTNPVDLTMLKLREINRYLMGQDVIRDLKDRGLWKLVRTGQAPPPGYVRLADKSARVWGPPHVTVEEAFDERQMAALNKVARDLGINMERKVNVGGAGRWGYAARPTALEPGQVVAKFGGPESVLAHEIGHQIDYRWNLMKRLEAEPDKALRQTYRKQARALADLRAEDKPVSPGFKSYLRSGPEKAAVMLEAYIHAPERFREVAPELYDWFDKFVKATPALKGLEDAKPSLVLGSDTATMKLPGPTLAGEYWLPEPVAQVLENYLSPGIRGKAFESYRTLGNVLNQAQLGVSAFHLGFVGFDAATSKTALALRHLLSGDVVGAAKSAAEAPFSPITTLLKGDQLIRAYRGGPATPELAALVQHFVEAGGRDRQDAFYRTKMYEKFRTALAEGRYGNAALRALPGVVDAVTKPLFEWYVPRMKAGVFMDLARFELEKLGPDAKPDDVRLAMQKAYDSVENRMGQLAYDNLNWNRVVKDLAMASTRSVGWNVGTARELGGGVTDLVRSLNEARKGNGFEISNRTAYLAALPITAGIVGSIACYLYTGHWPLTLKDAQYPPTGRTNPDGTEERVQLPSYWKDVHAYMTHPWETLKHKANPEVAMAIQLLENKDYYGNLIRNPDDPALQQAMQAGKYVAREAVPFGIQNALQARRRGQSAATQAAAQIGITAAPRDVVRSDAENKMYEYLNRQGKTSLTPEEADAQNTRYDIERQLKSDPKAGIAALRDAVQKGTVSLKQAATMIERGAKDPGALHFQELQPAQALEVYRLGTPEERAQWWPDVVQKLGTAMKNGDRETVSAFEKARPGALPRATPPKAAAR